MGVLQGLRSHVCGLRQSLHVHDGLLRMKRDLVIKVTRVLDDSLSGTLVGVREEFVVSTSSVEEHLFLHVLVHVRNHRSLVGVEVEASVHQAVVPFRLHALLLRYRQSLDLNFLSERHLLGNVRTQQRKCALLAIGGLVCYFQSFYVLKCTSPDCQAWSCYGRDVAVFLFNVFPGGNLRRLHHGRGHLRVILPNFDHLARLERLVL
mmetsp:Transcript_21773/g.33632  ORF Transcript_21773/g.33632 Transcript_21773/m.33632 type:complete len:206 (-) Transcript_21773:2491-3108(-)